MKEGKIENQDIARAGEEMSAKDFRRFGREIVDWIADYLEQIEERPVLAQVAPGELREKLPSSAPLEGEPMSEILSDVDRLIVPALTHWNHPMFFALFATSSSAPGIFGEMLSAAFDVKAMLWRTSPASTELEEVTLSWLRQMMNLPEEFEGIIYDTASISSMHAIAAAREMLDRNIRELGMSGRPELPLLRVYCSEQAHSSIEKGIVTLGLGQRALVKISTDAEYRMDVEALKHAVAQDRKNGALPCAVVATVGTTSTASIDPVEAIADICEKENLWLHVDAAYAGSAAVVPELQRILSGCARADSLVTNPHKWLFTPFDLSVLYTRRLDVLKRAFSLVPEYLKTSEPETVRNQMDYGVQLGRRFRSLKLWMVLRYFGQNGLAARIREHCRLANLFSSWIEASADWELVAPVQLSLVCFRCRPQKPEMSEVELNALNEQIMNDINATGRAYLSHTKLRDRFTLRLAIGNIRTTETHVRKVWQLLEETAEGYVSSSSRAVDA
jgi:aromatic-L-amino-acid/L-tryptophan decarboxylase